jgi:aspartyl-tRNA(Asn)/glutamyl-tRNA(Gln) amidotransferase subunit A
VINEYSRLSASDIISGLRERKFSAVEIFYAALRESEKKRFLNSFISVTREKGLIQAEEADKKIAAGDIEGALLGVPIALKDNICYADYPTTCGSKILRNFIPPYNATCVHRLLENGAVILGKTNMDEFAMGSSNENSYFGPVLNPRGEGLAPGGSSGGSAVAVAAGIVPIAFGSETGGSVRQPAAFCGVYGLKPSYGAVSRYGLVAFASSMDQIGPLARNIRDLALAFSVVRGRDELDSTSVNIECPQFSEMLDPNRKFRIGVPKEFFGKGLDRQVELKIRTAIEIFENDGCQIVDISLPLCPAAVAIYYIIADAEASSNLARFDGVKYGLRIADADLFKMYCKTRQAGFGAEVKRRIILGTYVLSAGYYDAYYLKAQKVRELLRRDFEKAFAQVDLILTPTTPTAAFKIGEKIDDPLAMYLSDIYTAPANLAGIPAISMPCGNTSDGRPVGVQLMAPMFDELSLFQAGAKFERAIG